MLITDKLGYLNYNPKAVHEFTHDPEQFVLNTRHY